MRQISEQEKINYLRLIRSENVGPVTFCTLLEYFGSVDEALRNLGEFAKRGGRTKPIRLCDKVAAEKEFADTYALGGEILVVGEECYPLMLKSVVGSPPVISVLGNKEAFNNSAIAIVGTRDASLNGRNMASKLAFEVVKAGFTVVSGMALGIDASAHEGALNAMYDSDRSEEDFFTGDKGKGNTIAVLGCGIDTVYPSSNKKLYYKIKQKGLLLSEYPLSSAVNPMNFPRRNRIISALSLGVLVVEARLKSGSLITARFAIEQGREVLAIPGSPLDLRCQGSNHLIKQGAMLVEKPSDVVSFLQMSPSITVKHKLQEADVSVFDYKPERLDEDVLTDARKDILTLLGNGTVGVDDIIRASGIGAAAVNIVLVELELAGKLERLAGNMVNLLGETNDW